MYFHYVAIVSPWKKAWHFILTNLNSLYLRKLCGKLSWNWASGSWGKDSYTCMYILTLLLLSPLRKKAIRSSPLPKYVLCQCWLKLAQWFWRRRFSKIFNIFSLRGHYLPLENTFEQIWISFTHYKNNSCQIKLKLAKRFLRRRFSKVICIILRCCFYFHLEKRQILSFDLN